MRVLFVEFFDRHFCIRFQEKILLSSVCNGAWAASRAKPAGTQLLSSLFMFSPYYDKEICKLSRGMYSGIIVYNHSDRPVLIYITKNPLRKAEGKKSYCIQKKDP